MIRQLCILFATALLCVACKKDAPPEGEKAPPPATARPPNAEVVAAVQKHVEKCTVNVDQGQAYSCKDNVSSEFRDWVRKQKPADLMETLATLVNGPDPKVSAAAIALAAETHDALDEAALKANATPYALEQMLAALKANQKNRAARLAIPATHLAMLAGKADALYAVVDTHPTKEARENAYSNLMVHGRMAAFPKIKAVAGDETMLKAALRAPRNMRRATDAEKNEYCPWAQGYLGHADLDVAAHAGYVMLNCGGAHIEPLLAEAEKRLAAKQYKNPFAMVMREPCFEFITGVTGKAAREAQCEKVFTFLEKAANDKTVDDATRGLALWNIYYQRRDKKTLDLMRRYQNHQVKEIAKRANEAIKSLTETYKLK